MKILAFYVRMWCCCLKLWFEVQNLDVLCWVWGCGHWSVSIMHVRDMSSPAKELVSAFWAMIFHIVIIAFVILIIIAARPSVCSSSRMGGRERDGSRKGKWEGQWGERWTGRGRESWGEEEEGDWSVPRLALLSQRRNSTPAFCFHTCMCTHAVLR